MTTGVVKFACEVEMKLTSYAERARDALARDVIRSDAEAARDNDDVVCSTRPLDELGDTVGVIG